MARQNRFVIKHPSGTFFSHCDIVGTRDSIEKDGTGNKFVHDRHVLAPVFHAVASKFDSKQDADGMLTHSFLQDPKTFDGCTVEPEDDG